MADSVFADTGDWAALVNPRDQLHGVATAWYADVERQQQRVATTDWVLVETVPLVSMRAPARRAELLAFVADLLRDASIEVVHVTRRMRDQAWARLERRPDRRWSWTDATSFVLMQERGLTRALAHDPHFREAGFEPLLQGRPELPG